MSSKRPVSSVPELATQGQDKKPSSQDYNEVAGSGRAREYQARVLNKKFESRRKGNTKPAKW